MSPQCNKHVDTSYMLLQTRSPIKVDHSEITRWRQAMSFLRFVEKCYFSSLVFDRLVHLQCRVGNMNVGILCAQRSN